MRHWAGDEAAPGLPTTPPGSRPGLHCLCSPHVHGWAARPLAPLCSALSPGTQPFCLLAVYVPAACTAELPAQPAPSAMQTPTAQPLRLSLSASPGPPSVLRPSPCSVKSPSKGQHHPEPEAVPEASAPALGRSIGFCQVQPAHVCMVLSPHSWCQSLWTGDPKLHSHSHSPPICLPQGHQSSFFLKPDLIMSFLSFRPFNDSRLPRDASGLDSPASKLRDLQPHDLTLDLPAAWLQKHFLFF